MSPQIYKAPNDKEPEGSAKIYNSRGDPEENTWDSKNPNQEREYTLSISEEDRKKSFETEDKRWSTANRVRDWVILVILIIFWIGFQLSFYFLEPGLR